MPQPHISLCFCLSLFTILVHFLVKVDTIVQGLQLVGCRARVFRILRRLNSQYTATLSSHVCVTVYSMCFITSPPIISYRQRALSPAIQVVFLLSCLHFFRLFSEEEDDTVDLSLCWLTSQLLNQRICSKPLPPK